MVHATARIADARKQLQIVHEEIDDPIIASELVKADAMLEGVHSHIRNGPPP